MDAFHPFPSTEVLTSEESVYQYIPSNGNSRSAGSAVGTPSAPIYPDSPPALEAWKSKVAPPASIEFTLEPGGSELDGTVADCCGLEASVRRRTAHLKCWGLSGLVAELLLRSLVAP
jgi:hypothetical protein